MAETKYGEVKVVFYRGEEEIFHHALRRPFVPLQLWHDLRLICRVCAVIVQMMYQEQKKEE